MDVAPQAVAGTAGKPSRAREPEGKPGHAQSFLALTALGVVFGDIGTSPLYTFATTLAAIGHAPAAGDILGIVSLTFWALMLIISVKYVGLVLRADNDGEGGILALLSLVEHRDATGQRAKLSIVIVLGVIGAALLYGDGVITPAISVLSAIEGHKVQPAGRELRGAGDACHPGRIVRSAIPRHRQRRPAVRPGDGGLVRRHRRARPREHLASAGDPPSVQSA